MTAVDAGSVFLPRSDVLIVLAFVTFAGCDPCACVNGCVRSYEIQDEPATEPVTVRPPAVTIQNHQESGMDCEIEQIPHSLPAGRHVALLTIRGRGGLPARYSADLVSLGKESEQAELCADAARSFPSVEELDRETVELGATVCVVGDVKASTSCTQKGCGY